jgi:hypothetical protein
MISVETLKSVLDYDPNTGEFRWKIRKPDTFKSGKYSADRVANAWNVKYAGKPAFTSQDSVGYLQTNICSKVCRAHRVAFAMHYGVWPKRYIDHINGDKTDNRISNLREVSNQENSKNSRISSSNKSGCAGVRWIEDKKKWRSEICVDGRSKHLGIFADFDDAVMCRKQAEDKYGFHPNHGSPPK